MIHVRDDQTNLKSPSIRTPYEQKTQTFALPPLSVAVAVAATAAVVPFRTKAGRGVLSTKVDLLN